MVLFFGNCSGQGRPEDDSLHSVKEPVYAGQFYPSSANEMNSLFKTWFGNAEKLNGKKVHGMILPHAGYVYSGKVAASGYASIPENTTYEHVFLIASSHNVSFEGAAVYLDGDFKTPLGIVKTDTELGKKLVGKKGAIINMPSAFMKEHSIEVHLPFIRYTFPENTHIVPLIVGTQSPGKCREIAELLKSYAGKNSLFIISSDFSHYPAYDEAVANDHTTAEVIMQGSASGLIKYIALEDSKDIPGLVTSLCGWSSVLTYLYLIEGQNDLKAEKIMYMNSGDAEVGSKDRVVGYNSIVFFREQEQEKTFTIGRDDRKKLLDLARKTIMDYIKSGEKPSTDPYDFSETLKTPCGVFVSLHEEGRLRGCIGTFSPDKPLYESVISMAIASSTQDSRFEPVNETEINELEIEISVLTPLKKINSIDEIIPGKHGIYIKKGYNSGTFLPQVAVETGWTLEEFLGHCSKDKAGIGWDGWKTAEIYTYEAIVFSEKDY